jgi:molecular chaperone DnaK (HSP70)
VIAVFTFGGDIRDARRDLKTSVDQAMQASQKADVATKQAESAMAELLMARDELRQVLDATTKQQAFNADVTDRVSRSVTRSEFKSAIEQRVLPRLERIEKALQEAAK